MYGQENSLNSFKYSVDSIVQQIFILNFVFRTPLAFTDIFSEFKAAFFDKKNPHFRAKNEFEIPFSSERIQNPSFENLWKSIALVF